MKKSLLAVAAMGAFASAAQAQSSVTVYGILDVGYMGSNARANSGTAGSGSGYNQVTKTTTNSFNASNQQTSRLGFKGTEDLGGGSSAFFTVELGLQPQNGNLSGSAPTTSTNNNIMNNGGAAIDNRQSFVGLKKNGLGQVAFGRQYTPIFNAGAVTDPGQYNNVAGSLIYAGVPTTSSPSVGNTSTDIGTYGSFTNRASNALTFQTDKFAGAGLSGMYALNNNNATVNAGAPTTVGGYGTGGANNFSGWGLSADFTLNKFYIVGAYQAFTIQQYSPTAAGTVALGGIDGNGVTQSTTVATNATNQNNQSDKQYYFGSTYDFGILKAYAQYANRSIYQNSGLFVAGVPAGQQAKKSVTQIGVRSYITPTIESWASVGTFTGQTNNATTSTYIGVGPGGLYTTVKGIGYQLGSNYYLSKRTNLYAIYGQSSSTSVAGGTPGSGSGVGMYALGVRHTF